MHIHVLYVYVFSYDIPDRKLCLMVKCSLVCMIWKKIGWCFKLLHFDFFYFLLIVSHRLFPPPPPSLPPPVRIMWSYFHSVISQWFHIRSNISGLAICFTCPEGKYCNERSGTPLDCPKGHYCPMGSHQHNWKKCPPGTWNPTVGFWCKVFYQIQSYLLPPYTKLFNFIKQIRESKLIRPNLVERNFMHTHIHIGHHFASIIFLYYHTC